jgi:hypothetical protein
MTTTCSKIMAFLSFAGLTMACAQDDPAEQPALGFEILQIVSLGEINVWVNSEMSEQEFDAIDLPFGWFKNQPRESDPDGGRFLRSPDAAVDGPLTEQVFFGYSWRHNATVVETGIMMDQQGLLEATRVAKYHELTYNAGSTVHILVSPEAECYLRVSRDFNRASEVPTLPSSWQIVAEELPDALVLQLPNPTLNIRADNEDSFQGPVPTEALPQGAALWLARNGLPQDTDLALDLNGDGVSLLMAYALGLDPSLNQAGSLLVPVVDQEKFGISFYGANPRVEYTVERSIDMKQWTAQDVLITEPDASGQRTAWIDRNFARSFLRLVVSETSMGD